MGWRETCAAPPCLSFSGKRFSVPIPKFADICSTLSSELRNQRDTSNYVILVPL